MEHKSSNAERLRGTVSYIRRIATRLHDNSIPHSLQKPRFASAVREETVSFSRSQPPVMKLQTLLLVKRHIQDYPGRFCAANWAWASNVREVLTFGTAPENFRCCIAGHVLLLSEVFDERSLLRYSVSCDDGYLGRCARQVLGLSDEERRALFYPSQWAEPYRTSYYLAPNRLAEAQAAVGYLDHFIARSAPFTAGERQAAQRGAVVHQHHRPATLLEPLYVSR